MLAAISPEALPALRIAGTFLLIINLIGGRVLLSQYFRYRFGRDFCEAATNPKLRSIRTVDL